MAACVSVWPLVAWAEEGSFEKTSVALRTALHYDPSVEVPLTKLVELYQAENKLEELLGLYISHVSQYPQDANAKLVLGRIYMQVGDRRAHELLRDAAKSHPEHALLAWQYSRWLDQQRDPKALEEMARAIALETSATRRVQWYGDLIRAASIQAREDLVLTQTQKFLEEQAMTPLQRLRWARQTLESKLVKTSELLLKDLATDRLGTDGEVEAVMLQSELWVQKGKKDEAIQALDKLLDRLAPEYWRRRDILMLRIDIAGDGAEREKLVAQARERWTSSSGKTAASALTLVDILEASHRTDEAFKVLQEAVAAFPAHPQLEPRFLEAWERKGIDPEALKWLTETVAKVPAREDLKLRQVRWMYMSGKPDEAIKTLAPLLAPLTPADKVSRSVELSRWLRRQNQLKEAATLLESVLETDSARWDLRRELAELYLAQRRRDDAARLLTGEWTADLPPDARLEITQFLLSKQMWVQAREVIEPWLASQPGAFDGHLLMARIYHKLGQDEKVLESLSKTRLLCDTESRYLGWLDTLLEFASAREQLPQWIRHEAGQLRPEANVKWDETTLIRWQKLVEQALNRKEEKVAEELLQVALAVPDVAEPVRLEFDRLRLSIMAADSDRVLDAEQGLRAMMDKDVQHKEEHRLRLALLYRQSQRMDLAYATLEQLVPSQISQTSDLRLAVTACREFELRAQAMACAERLTQLEPAEKAHWAQWLELLAQEGQEERFRVGVREVMGRSKNWNLSDDTLAELRRHLIFSQWRSVLRKVVEQPPDWAAARREAAGLLSLEELNPEQRRWSEWIVALMSQKLGDKPAVDAALAKLKQLDGASWLPFPDGMDLSVEQARRWLSTPPVELAVVRDDKAPIPPFTFEWGFSLEPERVVTKVVPLPQHNLVMLCDDSQRVFAVDLRTGKLRWQVRVTQESASSQGSAQLRRTGLVLSSASARAMPMGRYYHNNQIELKVPVELAAVSGKICYVSGGKVYCLNAENGEVLWECGLFDEDSALPSMARPQTRIAASGKMVVVWNAVQSMAYALDVETGKLVWQTQIPQKSPGVSNASYGNDMYARIRSGLTVEGDRAFVFSSAAAVLSLKDGQVLWRLGENDIPSFPIDLPAADQAPTLGPLSSGGNQIVFTTIGASSRSNMLFSNRMNRAYGMRGNMRGTRWTYAGSMKAVLQNPYATKAVMHKDGIYVINASGSSSISAMGLPVNEGVLSGALLGFAGSRMVVQNMGSVAVSDGANSSAYLPLGLAMGEAASSAAGSVPFTTFALSGSRIYAATGDRLQAADARSGGVLFDVKMPEDMAAWFKSLPKPQPVAVQPGMPGNGVQQDGARRTMVPQGVFIQDVRGGGTLCESQAAIAGDRWVFALGDGAVVCISASVLSPAPHE